MDKYEELYNKLDASQRWTVATAIMWEGSTECLSEEEKEFFEYLKALPRDERWNICEKLEREGLDDAGNLYDDDFFDSFNDL